jgi:hypothetical protein
MLGSEAVAEQAESDTAALALLSPMRHMTIYMVRSVTWTRSIWPTPRRI